MPRHEYRCACGATDERYTALADLAQPVPCACGQPMERLLTGVRTKVFMPYYHVGLGRRIESERQLQSEMAARGKRPADETVPYDRARAKTGRGNTMTEKTPMVY